MSNKSNEEHPEIIEIINICKIFPDDTVCQKIKEEEKSHSTEEPVEEEDNPDEDWDSTPRI